MEQPGAAVHVLQSVPGVLLTEAQAAELRSLGSIRSVLTASAGDLLRKSTMTANQCVGRFRCRH